MKKVLSYVLSVLILASLFSININVFAAKYEYEFIDPANENEVHEIIDDIYNITEEYYAVYHKDDDNSFIGAYNNKFWWPIGSAETTEENGVIFAKGDPETTNVTSPFGPRVINGVAGNHGGVDIAGGSGEGNVNIIAAKSGVVIYPTSDSQTQYPRGYYCSSDGGGYGNYVMIQHSDGTITVYAHMYTNSITVRAGDTVSQGQVIGKLGSTGCSTGGHLHFEVRVNQQRVDPLLYISADDPRPSGSGGQFPVATTTLSKDEFVYMARDYLEKTGKGSSLFYKEIENVYEWSLKYGVNPELVLVTALTENGVNARKDNNYWGIGFYTGNQHGTSYASLEEGIHAYADLLASYRNNPSYANSINSRAQEREAAGCDPLGYGSPDTLSGTQSLYSSFGYRFNPGNWGAGGCVYLNGHMYESDYCSKVPTCTDYGTDASGNFWHHCSAESALTVIEQCDYTKWQVQKKTSVRFAIFGL